MSKVGANVELPPWMIEMEDRVTVSVRNSRSFTCKELLLVHSHHIVELVIVQEPCTKHPLQEMISINRDFYTTTLSATEWLLQNCFLPTMQMQMQMWEESSSACLHCVKKALAACMVNSAGGITRREEEEEEVRRRRTTDLLRRSPTT